MLEAWPWTLLPDETWCSVNQRLVECWLLWKASEKSTPCVLHQGAFSHKASPSWMHTPHQGPCALHPLPPAPPHSQSIKKGFLYCSNATRPSFRPLARSLGSTFSLFILTSPMLTSLKSILKTYLQMGRHAVLWQVAFFISFLAIEWESISGEERRW